ncbi:MAG: hypothetical protein ACREVK_04780 [Gammaproteobacteria bacterium]
MREHLGDHDGIFDGGDDGQSAPALETLFNIDIGDSSLPVLPLLVGYGPSASSGPNPPYRRVIYALLEQD